MVHPSVHHLPLPFGGVAPSTVIPGGKACYRACQNAGTWALKMAGLSLIGEDGPWDFGGSWAGSESGLATIASPSNRGGVMIGRERGVLVRHYLEQGLSKAAVARRIACSDRGSAMTTALPARCPTPVAPLPLRGSARTLTRSMAKTLTFSMPIDNIPARPDNSRTIRPGAGSRSPGARSSRPPNRSSSCAGARTYPSEHRPVRFDPR